jgi:hypothetical protein
MIFHRSIPMFLSALGPLTAASFPMVPASAQVLTVAGVKGYWLQSLERQRVRQKGDALPDEIRAGRHDLAAQLVCLSHNVEAWARQGEEAKAREAAEELLALRQQVAGGKVC